MLKIRINRCDGIGENELDIRFGTTCDNHCPFCFTRNAGIPPSKFYLTDTFECMDDISSILGNSYHVGVFFDKEEPYYKIKGVCYPLGTEVLYDSNVGTVWVAGEISKECR